MIVEPKKIENKSFEIIKNELEYFVDSKKEPTVIRVIHTTADFEYAEILDIHDNAIDAGIAAIKNGCRIYTDTRMIMAGINKNILKQHNCEVYSLIDNENVSKEAKERGVTRSIVGMEKAVQDPETKIFVIGNAPTALFTLKNSIEEGRAKPELVIGVPVGFVGAAESKEEIKKVDVPYITTDGRKGGSTVAVAILNSIIYQI